MSNPRTGASLAAAQAAMSTASGPDCGAGGRRALVPDLIRRAMAAAEQVEDPVAKASALIEVALARASAGNTTGAIQSLAEARSVTAKITDNSAASDSLRDIGDAQAKIGDAAGEKKSLSAPLLRAQTIADLPAQCNLVAQTTASQAEAGYTAGSGKSFSTARVIAQGIADPVGVTFGLASIARCQIEEGDLTRGKATAKEAQQECEQIRNRPNSEPNNDRYRRDRKCGLAVVGVLASSGLMDQAEASTDDIVDGYMKSSARVDIVSALCGSGDISGAISLVPQITDSIRKEVALQFIGAAQAKAGDIDAARVTAEKLPSDGDWRDGILSAIAVAPVRKGDGAGGATAAQLLPNPNWKAITLSHIVEVVMKPAK